MIERNHLEDIVKRQKEIRKMQSKLNDEFNKYYKELFEKAKSVLQWKDDNLEQHFLKHKRHGHIHEIRENSIVLCMPDYDAELPTQYYNVSFDEIYSEDWKEKALIEYEKSKQQLILEKENLKRQKLIEIEQRERAEYERLKAKYESSDYNTIEL